MVPGGLVDRFYPAFAATDGLTPIVATHEAGAAYMADGYARASGRFGACLVIGTPGLTNVMTPMAAALTDGSPVLVVSGEVPTSWEGRGGFQDASIAYSSTSAATRPASPRSRRSARRRRSDTTTCRQR